MLLLDDVYYPYTPIVWRPDFQMAGTRSNVVDDFHLNRIVVGQAHAPYDPDTFQQHRKIWQQAWTFSFERVPLAFADVLQQISDNGKLITLKYNDMMARVDTRCYRLDTSYRAYWTPTWPVRPAAWVSGAQVWTGTVKINGVTADGSNPGDVYPTTGTVLFDAPLGADDVVTISYDWYFRCYIAQNFKVAPVDERYDLWAADGTFIQADLQNPTTGYPFEV
jgi:hypothetical protein